MTIRSICHKVDEEALEEYLFGRLSSDQRRELEAHLDQCVPCRLRREKVQHQITELKTALQLFESMRSIEKRRFPRTSTSGRVLVRLATGRRGGLVAHGRLKDKSHGGLGLICDRRYRIGTRVLITRGSRELCGVVRYCRPLETGYQIGIELSAA